jgi:hypothetical protein
MCDCGALDCPSCGPAQGYEVVRVWVNGRWVWRNPPDDENYEEEGVEGDYDDR